MSDDPILRAHCNRQLVDPEAFPRRDESVVVSDELLSSIADEIGGRRVRISGPAPGHPAVAVTFKKLTEADERLALDEATAFHGSLIQRGSPESLEAWRWVPTPDEIAIARIKRSVVAIDGVPFDQAETIPDFRARWSPNAAFPNQYDPSAQWPQLAAEQVQASE